MMLSGRDCLIRALLGLGLGAFACASQDRDEAVAVPAFDSVPRFTLLPSSHTGVTFRNELSETPVLNGFTYEYFYNGGGVAVGDLNGDGLPDLYFTSNTGGNRLFVNRGELRFDDVTEASGAGDGRDWATGVTFADVNGDGRLDIYVSYSGPSTDPDRRRNRLYMNQGVHDGIPRFDEQAAAYGLDSPAYSTQAAFFDSDGDGDLDMYLMNHGADVHRSLAEMEAGHSPHEIDRLYRNDGDHFTDISAEAGIADTNLGFGLGLSIGDVNNDRKPDIYVANDYAGRDHLYLGGRGGRFRDVLTESMHHIPYASMGSDIADIDGDGWLDLFVAEMAMQTHYDRKTTESGTEAERFSEAARAGQHYQYAANALQWNRGVRENGVPVFSEIASLAGVSRSDWSWAALFADLDNSGRPDLFVTTGIAGNYIDVDYNDYRARRTAQVMAEEGRITHSLVVDLLQNLPHRRVPNQAFRNEGGVQFTNRTAEWGLDQPSFSNGAVYADLDRDGDLDLVVNNLMGEAFIYRNESRTLDRAHFLALRLDGPAGNPFGIGARVRLKAGGRRQMQEMRLTRGYQSSVEPVLHFGLGEHTAVDTLEVRWPDGAVEVRAGVSADQYLDIAHRDARAVSEIVSATRAEVLFEAAPGALRPTPRHRASVSLPDSTLEPYPTRRVEVALAMGDLDGDGLDDFVFGGGAGEPLHIYRQALDGAFDRTSSIVTAAAPTAASIFDADGDGRNDVLLASDESRGRGKAVQRLRLYSNEGGLSFRETGQEVAELAATAVVLAPGDFDGDGVMDVFIGAHTAPGQSPGAGSRLLRNDGGTWRDVTGEVAPALAELRTVRDAVWADVDGNGRPDLVIAAEWRPITILLNEGGRLRDGTSAAGIDGLTGWWQSVAAEDFNGDGRIDIVAGNMGLNHPYRPTNDAPFELYIHDFGGGGRRLALPAYYENGRQYPWFGRTRMAWDIPMLLRRYPTHAAFARASLAEVLGVGPLRDAERYEARAFASMLLENEGGGRFRATPLPLPAQVAPMMALIADDFDNDGAMDLITAGNLTALDVSVPKADGGVGLFLRGDGAGGFAAIAPHESGLLLEGEVRRLAVVRSGARSLIAAVAGAAALHVRVRVRDDSLPE